HATAWNSGGRLWRRLRGEHAGQQERTVLQRKAIHAQLFPRSARRPGSGAVGARPTRRITTSEPYHVACNPAPGAGVLIPVSANIATARSFSDPSPTVPLSSYCFTSV